MDTQQVGQRRLLRQGRCLSSVEKFVKVLSKFTDFGHLEQSTLGSLTLRLRHTDLHSRVEL